MLTKPSSGWSDFQLEDTSVYGLSYLSDIAFDWLAQAIHGLETMMPFCVKGYLEPDRFLCVVSYWNCHIVCEDEDWNPLDAEGIINEFSHTDMIQFCKYLYNDISENIDDWISFNDYEELDLTERKADIIRKLERLKDLISQREKCFYRNRCFY